MIGFLSLYFQQIYFRGMKINKFEMKDRERDTKGYKFFAEIDIVMVDIGSEIERHSVLGV